MRDVLENAVGWLVPIGIVAAIVLARRRYRDKYAADVAQARAEGYAAAKVELGISQQVTVNAGNIANDVGALDHQCAHPFACVRCAPVLFRVLRGGGRDPAALPVSGERVSARVDHYDDDYHDNSSGPYDGSVVRSVGAGVGDDGGRGASARGVGGYGAGGERVEGVPCASLSEIVGARRPELAADMLRRPWAYDVADPRFEGVR